MREDIIRIVPGDLHIAPFRKDGVTYTTPACIWVLPDIEK